MSFVICVCGVNFSVMMGDGRLIKYPERTIEDEYYPKVFKINKNVLIGTTGDPLPIDEAFGELRNYNVEYLTLEKIRKIFINKLKTLHTNSLGVKVIFSGKNRRGQFVISTVDSTNGFNFEDLYPNNTNLINAFSGNNNRLCTSIVDSNLSNKSFSCIEELEDAMEQCIINVASIDDTVNTNILKAVIK